MARGLTEVVFQTALPAGQVHHLSATMHTGRVTLTPIVVNGSGYPTRLLAGLTGFGDRTRAMMDALQEFLSDARVVQEDARSVSVIGDLAPRARALLDATLGEALHGTPHDLIFRPSLIKGGWLYASVVTTKDTPAEEVVHRLSRMLSERGIGARLVRLDDYHPEHQGLGTYEEALTPKQSEILKMALALGLYDTPRRCTLDDLADIFGISKAAAHNRMKGAERKILARYFDE